MTFNLPQWSIKYQTKSSRIKFARDWICTERFWHRSVVVSEAALSLRLAGKLNKKIGPEFMKTDHAGFESVGRHYELLNQNAYKLPTLNHMAKKRAYRFLVSP